MATTARGSIDGRCPSCCLFWPACICRRRHPPPLCTPTTNATLPQKPPGSFLLFTFDRRVTAGSTTKIPREKKSQGKLQSHSPLYPSKLSKSGYHIIGITNQTPIATLAKNPITFRRFYLQHQLHVSRSLDTGSLTKIGIRQAPQILGWGLRASIQHSAGSGSFLSSPQLQPPKLGSSSCLPFQSATNNHPLRPLSPCPPAGQGRPSHHFPGPGSFF